MSPQVIAHRGASAVFPEHTRYAYVEALRVGAQALECDVRLTLDGHLVCIHDRTVQRTSDGIGAISAMTLEQLRSLNFAHHVSSEPQGILTLRELLALVAETDRRVEVAVETKHPTRSGGRVERALAEVLQYFGWSSSTDDKPSPVRVMSFSPVALARMHRIAPELNLVLLLEHLWLPWRDGSLPPGVTTAGIDVRLLREHVDYVDKAHRVGGSVHVWTVNDPLDVERCVAAGVDGIITDRPGDVIAQLARHGLWASGPVEPGRSDSAQD